MYYPVRIPDQLASLVRAARKRSHLSQAALAGKLGITQQAYSQLERAPASASFERVLQLLAMLDVEIVLRERRTPGKGAPGNW